MRIITLLPAALWLVVSSSTADELEQWPSHPVLVVAPGMTEVVDENASLELLADGFSWAEGPVAEPGSGDILFSDVPNNKVYRWNLQRGLSEYLSPSGYTGLYADNALQEGANGLLFNQRQQLVLAQHGDRRLAVLTDDTVTPAVFQTLILDIDGKRFNSPNDLVQHSSGAYYFTDPPYGLRGADASAEKELAINGVYRVVEGQQATLVAKQLTRPNGLAFSPDEKWLYVANSDPGAAQWWRFAVNTDGSLAEGQLFFDATAALASTEGLPDGLKVLPTGQLLATGPGGIWVFSPSGEHLGTIRTGVAAANVALSLDRHYLYITASNYLLRIKLALP